MAIFRDKRQSRLRLKIRKLVVKQCTIVTTGLMDRYLISDEWYDIGQVVFQVRGNEGGEDTQVRPGAVPVKTDIFLHKDRPGPFSRDSSKARKAMSVSGRCNITLRVIWIGSSLRQAHS